MHYLKVKTNAESGLFRHTARTNKNYGNKNINLEMTKNNYNLTDDDGRTQQQRMNDRLSQLTYRKQKNNTRLCSIIITAPKNLRPEDQEQFFKTAHKALQKMTGGQDNEVSSFVHLDECGTGGRPHMHYLFVPGIEIKGVLKLSAKNLITLKFLKELHPKMQNIIDTEFNHHDYKVVADDPADRAQSSDTIQQYKLKQDKIKELDNQIQKETKILCDILNEHFSEMGDIHRQQKLAKNDLKKVSNRLEQAKELLSYYDNIFDEIKYELDSEYEQYLYSLTMAHDYLYQLEQTLNDDEPEL